VMGCAKLIGQCTLSERIRQNREVCQRRLVSYCRVARLDSMVNVSELTLAVVRFERAQDTVRSYQKVSSRITLAHVWGCTDIALPADLQNLNYPFVNYVEQGKRVSLSQHSE